MSERAKSSYAKHTFKPNPVEPTWCAVCGFPYDERNLHEHTDDEVAALRAKLTAAEAEAQQLKMEIAALTDGPSVDEWQAWLNAAKAEARQLREERDKAIRDRDLWEQQLNEVEAEGDRHAEQYRIRADTAEAENARLRSELEVEIAQREGDCARMQFDRDETLKAIARLQAENARLRSELEAAQAGRSETT